MRCLIWPVGGASFSCRRLVRQRLHTSAAESVTCCGSAAVAPTVALPTVTADEADDFAASRLSSHCRQRKRSYNVFLKVASQRESGHGRSGNPWQRSIVE